MEEGYNPNHSGEDANTPFTKTNKRIKIFIFLKKFCFT
jgi:hypothetical protein